MKNLTDFRCTSDELDQRVSTLFSLEPMRDELEQSWAMSNKLDQSQTYDQITFSLEATSDERTPMLAQGDELDHLAMNQVVVVQPYIEK